MLISLFAAMGMAMNAEVIEYTDGDFKYSLETETKTAALSKYSGSATEVTIPESVTHDDVTYSVTSLGESCFYYCTSLTSITIPSSVTSLEDYCFSGSSLTSIDIPSSMTSLGDGCFSACRAIISIDIPSSVTSLGDYCFDGCKSLTSIDIPSSVTSLGDGCFYGCTSLTSVTIPSSVTSLGGYCFSYCLALTSVTIPSSVTSLGNYCFCDCSALTSIIVDENNPVYDSRENCNAIIETESNTMIAGCASTVIPSSVTSLEDYCFSGSSLTSIDIPSSMTSLGDGCFSACSSLTSIIVDENNPVYDSRENCNAIIESASNNMIYGCKNTIIPSSVTSLGDRCFSGCSSLTSVDIPSSVTSLGERSFESCTSLTSIDIPYSVISLERYCFSGCSSLTSVDIPSSVTRLGERCFYDCSSLTSVTIPSSVTRLGGGCFNRCKSIKTMTCEIPTAKKGYFFSDTPIEQATLYVPESSLDSYKATSPWSSFGTILPISSDGIGEIATDGEAGIDAIYNLEGKRCNGTNRGLSIIRMSDGTTRKVLK